MKEALMEKIREAVASVIPITLIVLLLSATVASMPVGTLLLFLVVWVLRRLGVSFETEALASAHILQIFTSNTPLSVLTFLR